MEIFLQKQKESFELPYLHTNYFATLLKKYKMKKRLFPRVLATCFNAIEHYQR